MGERKCVKGQVIESEKEERKDPRGAEVEEGLEGQGRGHK